MYAGTTAGAGVEGTRLRDILSIGALSIRCANITSIIEQSSIDDLKIYYPIIIEHIFGWPGYRGWNLQGTKRDINASETNAVVRLLRSTGPLIDLSYRLMSDDNLSYEFLVTSLPLPLQRKLKQKEVPAYLANKLIQKFGLEYPEAISLNPFEFFYFTFAHVLLSDVVDSNYLYGWGTVSDSIYMDLFTDYLSFFFPCTGTGVPPVQYPIHSLKSVPSFNMPKLNTSNVTGSGDLNSSRPSLFKASVFQNDSVTERELSFAASVPEFRTHVWRSEVILNVIITMWLSVEGPAQTSYQFETILPSVELVKCVRAFTRHFHFFINSMSLTVEHPLDDIRRTGYPIFQNKLYVFLRYLFGHWSSDYSFRIVYETWLTYIQPWRYTKYDSSVMGKQTETETVTLDGKHYDFILENLLFYTTLFQLIIPRLSATDYNSIRNAHMAYRVAKVFCGIQGLKDIIKYIEESLGPDPIKSTIRSSTRHSDTSPSSWSLGFEDSHHHHNSLNQLPARHFHESATTGIKLANAKKRIRELEGQDFVYTPLFSDRTKDKVSKLLAIWFEAYSQLRRILPPKETNKQINSNKDSWFNKMLSMSSTEPQIIQPNEKMDQREKILTFLSCASDWLAVFFDLQKPTEMEYDAVDSRLLDEDSMFEGGLACGSVLPKGVFLPTLLECVGNPDLAGPRSNEYAVMIKLMHKISSNLNTVVVPTLSKIYFKDKWTSKLIRAAVAEPVLYVDYEKFGPSNSRRKERYLPPRINLRPLAHVNTPYIFIGIYLLGLFLGIDGFGWITIPYLIFFFYLVICAMCESRDTAPKLRTKFSKYLKQ